MSVVTAGHIRHTRKAHWEVAELPPLLTASGTRPINPERVEVSYYDGGRGQAWASVEIGGRRLYGNLRYQSRRYLVFRGERPARDYGGCESIDVLPSWAAELVLRHWPDDAWFVTPEPRLGAL